MGNKVVQIDENKKTLTVDDTVYDFTPVLQGMIMSKHPRISQWPSRDYQAYKSLSKQTKVRLFPNSAGAARPHATLKYNHLLRKMIVPGEMLVEEEESEFFAGNTTIRNELVHVWDALLRLKQLTRKE